MVTKLSALAGRAVTQSYLPQTGIKGAEKEAAILFSLQSDSEANWPIAFSLFYKNI